MSLLSLKSEKKFSVVIPTKNGGALFERVLHGLQKQSNWEMLELIVIDSGSNDQTLDVARKYGAKIVEIAPENFNHGATRDYGISIASCEIIVLMVQDAVANDLNLFQVILERFNEPNVAGVYVRQIPQPDADVLTKRNINNWLTGRKYSESRKISTIEDYENLKPIDKYFFCNFDNVCSAIRKKIWETHKFGEINFGEDIDWAERVLLSGFNIVYESGVSVTHSHDRPLSYEYKRTYICHRKLYSQFGLHLVPSVRGMLMSWIFSTGQDIKYVVAQNGEIGMKLRLVVKIPVLNFLGAIAQYRAVRDEIAGSICNVRGV